MNLEAKEKTYVKNSGVMCPRDGFVVFRQSELLTGRLGKVTLGGSNKSGLFQVCCQDQGMPHTVAPVLMGSCSRFGPLISRGTRHASQHPGCPSSAVLGQMSGEGSLSTWIGGASMHRWVTLRSS